MAENPVATLLRILAGVGLMQGPLGHQVLGQLLILGSSEVAVAGASVVIAAASRQRNAIGQAAIRTAAPAIAVNAIVHRDLKRLEQRSKQIEDRERLTDEAADTRRLIRSLRLDNDQLQHDLQKLVNEIERNRNRILQLSFENDALRNPPEGPDPVTSP